MYVFERVPLFNYADYTEGSIFVTKAIISDNYCYVIWT